jgi:hypothetical protein
MTPDVSAHSFDRPRERSAPSGFTGHALGGDVVTHFFTGPTLIVAIKPSCDGCHDFVFSALEELRHVTTVVVSRDDSESAEWANAVQTVFIAPELMDALDIKWPPFYVLLDPQRQLVLTEGVVFGPAQVAAEIASYLH